MKHSFGPAPKAPAIVACLMLLSSLPLGATTYVLGTDRDLLEQADLVAEIDVLEVLNAPGEAATDYIVLLGRTLAGDPPGSTAVIRQPGGEEPGGLVVHVFGAPRLDRGQRAIAFLSRQPDGTFGLLHWALGLFYRVPDGGRHLALRAFEDAVVLDQRLEPAADVARDYDRFSEWLADMSSGRPRSPDYFTRPAGDSLEASYTLLVSGGRNFRWFEFDDGGSVPWYFKNGGISGSLQWFQQALAAWNAESTTPVSFRYAGLTGATGGFARRDGRNAIIFGDPNREVTGRFVCGQGGVLAIGGVKATSVGNFRGRTYWRVVEADIVVNDGAECWLRGNSQRGQEVFAHELGHGLGIGHSKERGALMFPTGHGRGAFLHADDIAALRALYGGGGRGSDPPGGGGGGLGAPTNLAGKAVSSTRVELSWEDNSDESAFRISRKEGSSAWRFLKDVAADTIKVVLEGQEPGQTYEFVVHAKKGGSFSPASNIVKLTMPRRDSPGGAPGGEPDDEITKPKKLRARATSATTGWLRWRDKSDNETGFEVWLKAGDGPWQLWLEEPADTRRVTFRGATPGDRYSFRVRARNETTTSDWSNVASVRMPAG